MYLAAKKPRCSGKTWSRKYKTCLRLARAQLSEGAIEHTAQLIRDLEKQEDMAQLPRLFAGR